MDGTDWSPIVRPLTTLAAAQAEWAAAGGDPERGPALSGRSADGRVEWQVWSNDLGVFVQLIVGKAHARRGHDGNWRLIGDDVADMRECVRLAEAADGGAR